jgi:predicted amidophosphoribosyltransferase
LGREGRAHNLKGAIRVKSRSEIPARAIVLDDLMTTGATLNACATALREAGCAEVYGITLFYD